VPALHVDRARSASAPLPPSLPSHTLVSNSTDTGGFFISDRRPLHGLTLILVTALSIAILAPTARGQGFGLNDIGSCAVARAYAATGAPCHDASVIYWNPGAATTLPGLSIYGGAALIGVNGGFRADTTLHRYASNVPLSVPPHVFVNYTGRLGDRAASLGVGAYVPYGLTSQWNSTFPGRFEAQKASLQTIYIQPNVAVEVVPHVLTVGGGPIIGHSDVELDQALDLSSVGVPGAPAGTTFGLLGIPLGTQFGLAKIKGSATAYGWTVGALLHPFSTVQIGARFLSALTFKYSGSTATFQQTPTGLILAGGNLLGLPGGTPVDAVLAPQFASGGPLVSQSVSTKIVHPLQAEAGIGYTGLRQTTLDLDVAYVGWNSFQALPLTFGGPAALLSRSLLENYGNSWSARAGIEHVFGDSATGITGRGGFSYATTPAPPVTVTPLLPDMNRYNGAVGLGIPVARALSVDASYLHVFTQGRRGRITERTDPTQTAAELNSGFYDLAADVFSVSLRLHF
jgi:long-chain fatty acid transport protein